MCGIFHLWTTFAHKRTFMNVWIYRWFRMYQGIKVTKAQLISKVHQVSQPLHPSSAKWLSELLLHLHSHGRPDHTGACLQPFVTLRLALSAKCYFVKACQGHSHGHSIYDFSLFHLFRPSVSSRNGQHSAGRHTALSQSPSALFARHLFRKRHGVWVVSLFGRRLMHVHTSTVSRIWKDCVIIQIWIPASPSAWEKHNTQQHTTTTCGHLMHLVQPVAAAAFINPVKQLCCRVLPSFVRPNSCISSQILQYSRTSMENHCFCPTWPLQNPVSAKHSANGGQHCTVI